MFDVQSWLATGGVFLLALIVFAESGLLIGFFLPGDSLLFVAGFLTSDAGGNVLPPLPITAAVVFVAAVVGDQVGYLIGRRFGPSMFNRPRSRLFHPENVVRTREFMARRGPMAVVVARFVPVVRTFTPVVAGVAGMEYRRFVTYNVVGGVLWGIGVTSLGAALGRIEFIRHNLEYAAVIVVAVSLVPIALEYRRNRRAAH